MGHISMAVDNPNRALVMALISHISPHWTRSENISSTGLFFFLLSTKWMQHSYFAVRRISLEIKKTSQSKCKHNNKNNRCCLSYQWTGSNGQWAEGGVLAQVGTPSPITGEIRSTSWSCWTVGAQPQDQIDLSAQNGNYWHQDSLSLSSVMKQRVRQ